MYFIEVEPGVNIYVNDINPAGKKTLFFIHGWPVNYKMFEYQLNVLPQKNFRCVCMDIRGFGKSSAPWHGYSYNRMAEDVYNIIRTLNLNDIILIGFSMGGAIAIRYMALYAGYQIEKLALLAAAAPSFVQRPDFPYGQSVEAVNRLIYQTYINRPEMIKGFGETFFAKPITDSFRTWFHSLALEASSYATIKAAIALRDEDLRSDLGKINITTGIFHGVLDQVCPYDLAIMLSQGIKGSTLFPFEQSGHGLFYDELETLNQKLIQFIG